MTSVAIALHTQEQMSAGTAFDLWCMIGDSLRHVKNLPVINPQRARKEIARNEAVNIAGEHQTDFVMFIRDGVRFAPDTLVKLMARDQDIVGCKTIFHPKEVSADLTLVKRDVFAKLTKPYFRAEFFPGDNRYVDDDFVFMREAAKAGIDSFCDDVLTEKNLKYNANTCYLNGGKVDGNVLAICVPAIDIVYTHTALDIAKLIGQTIANVRGILLINPSWDRIETSRNMAIDTAMGYGCSHILFVDSDMRLPSDSIKRLLARGKEIVGCNAQKRDGTDVPVLNRDLFGKPFKPDRKPLVRVKHIGMAVTLIDMTVFDKLEKPWFWANYDLGTENWRGEDFVFCWGARGAGYSIWCDLGLSKEIGHIGVKTYYLKGA